MKLTGRVCDRCGVDEPLQKFYTLNKRMCFIGKHPILLCWNCISPEYSCSHCNREDILNKILE